MFTWIWIFGIVWCSGPAGPGGTRVLAASPPDRLSCEEFERGAHFDPYEVIDSMWKIFYFWGNTTEVYPIMFNLPAKQRIQRFRTVAEAIDPYMEIEWQKVTLIMEPRPGVQVLLLYGGTPGAFRGVVKMERRDAVRPHPVPLLKLADLRFKIVGPYMGMMCCEDLTQYALARMVEMPSTEKECEEAAATLGFRGPGGRSYFYVANLTKRQLDDEL